MMAIKITAITAPIPIPAFVEVVKPVGDELAISDDADGAGVIPVEGVVWLLSWLLSSGPTNVYAVFVTVSPDLSVAVITAKEDARVSLVMPLGDADVGSVEIADWTTSVVDAEIMSREVAERTSM